MDIVQNLREKLQRKPTIQEIEDEIFCTMSADRKIKISSDLTVFANELNKLHHGNGNNRSAESSHQSSPDIR